jgi:cell division initiation protein
MREVKITPLDIRRREFKRSVRGYLDEDVDLFLDGVAEELERMVKENDWLQDRVRALEEQAASHTHIREALEKTLVAAQLQSEEIRSNAEKEGESILRDAEAKAKALVADLYSQTQKVQQTLIQLKLLEEDFRFKFRALLEGYLKLLEEGPILLGDLKADGGHAEPAVEPPAKADAPLKEAGLDNDPTVDTEESAAFARGAARTSATAEEEARKAPVEQASHAGASSVAAPEIQQEDVTQVIDYATEESKADAAAAVSADRPAKQGKVGKSKKAASDKGVYFGRLEDDPDDPFPGNDVGPAKARDFEW